MPELEQTWAASISQKRPLIFGETIVDQFPGGEGVLGGAPFNVAWNLKGMGLDPYFVSSVGADSNGRQFIDRMESWGLDRDGLQMSEDKPTGSVTISFDGGEHQYRFEPDQAYDNIAAVDEIISGDSFELLYHGSLIYRSAVSKATLKKLIADTGLPRFVDINVRQPHFDLSWAGELLSGARWVKLNADELALLSGISVSTRREIDRAIVSLCETYGRATYFVTCGSEGAYAFDDGQSHFCNAPSAISVVDTVGAGDAFSAAIICGLLRKDSIPQAVERAVKFAARICGIKGATVEQRSLYEEGFL